MLSLHRAKLPLFVSVSPIFEFHSC
jgi:hypothetical protein